MASGVLRTPSRWWHGFRKTFSKSPQTSDDSSSSDSDSVPFNIPLKMLESQSAKIKARYPNATDTWIRNKATARLTKIYQDEVKKHVISAVNTESDCSSDYDLQEDTLITKTPLSRHDHESYAKHSQILHNIDSPEKLSHVLLNPIKRVDRLRLITNFKRDYEKSTLSSQRVRSTVFQMAMLHTELAVIHQLIIDRIHESSICVNNRWAFRDCFESKIKFISTTAEAEALDYMQEFRDEFEQLLRLTQLLQPQRQSILSFQEVMGILVYLAQDDNSLDSWPLTLATGSHCFNKIYSHVIDSSFTPTSAKRRYEMINSAKKKSTPDITARKNKSLLESIHLAAKPNSKQVTFTDEENSWLRDLTLTYHPDSQEMISPPSFSDLSSFIQPDVLCNLQDLRNRFDPTQVPYPEVVQMLNNQGANVSINPAHVNILVNITNLTHLPMVRAGDIMALCDQAIQHYNSVYHQPPAYNQYQSRQFNTSGFNTPTQYQYKDQSHSDPRTSTQHQHSLITPQTPSPFVSPITNSQDTYQGTPLSHTTRANATSAIHPLMPDDPVKRSHVSALVDEITALQKRIKLMRSASGSDDKLNLANIRILMEENTTKMQELYSIMGIPTDETGKPLQPQESSQNAPNPELDEMKRQLA